MKIADLLRDALHLLCFLAVPVGFLAVGLPAMGLGPDLARGPVQYETSLAHHLRICPACSADDGEPIIGSYLGCPEVHALMHQTADSMRRAPRPLHAG